MKAVAYLRVSTDKQTLAQQRYAIEQWAAVNNVSVVSWHEDHGLSGKLDVDKRPALVDALSALKKFRAVYLVAATRDRLSRDVRVMGTLENLVEDEGASVRTADGKSDDMSPEGQIMRGMFDLFAQYERAKTAMRVCSTNSSRRAVGLATGTAPYGWRIDGVSPNRKLVEVPEEQRTIKMIRELHADGFSQQAIAGMLEATGGFNKPRGKAWHVTTIARILKHNASDRVDGLEVVE